MKKHVSWITTAAMAVVCPLLTSCSGSKEGAEEEIRYVKTALAERISDAAELSYPGRTKSSEEVNVAFRVSGPIQRILVKEGQYVRKGQLIAQMDPRDYEVQLAATQAEYEQIKADAERVIALYQEEGTTASNYDRARYGLQQITEKLAHHKNQLADTHLYAPINGYVQHKIHESGETVSAGMPVVSMFNAGDVEIEVFVPASDYARQDELLSATCSFEVTPGKIYPLEIVRVSKEANASQLYAARLRIKGDYDRQKITPGMSTMVYVSYHAPNEVDGVTVPTTAIDRQDGKCSVFVLDTQAGIVKRRAVEVGRIDLDGNIQVLEGLKPQEKVVCAGVRYLTDGQRVKEMEKTSKANVGGLL
ncbi:MAG: efflux RND transporter periplasmic adaptor subunit [Bacteroidaceae bacterium]|nr:efflux RND transporter periplasmic adaptor subunit [Bacteroidaceae bacterium]